MVQIGEDAVSETTIYVKTPKGIEELNTRSHGLSPKFRQMLVLQDGKRSRGEIAEMVPDGEELLAKLIADGFIAPLQQSSGEEKSIAKIERPQNDAERFEMAKNFMRNTLQTYLGVMGSGVISQVDKCNNFDELRLVYGQWKEAMEFSNDARKQLADLDVRLAALLS
jgi:hypothetical protein